MILPVRVRVQVLPHEGKSCIERHGAEVEQSPGNPDHAELYGLSFRLSIRQEAPKVLNVTRVASVNCPSMEIPLRPYLVACAGHRRRRHCALCSSELRAVGGGSFEKGERGGRAGRYRGGMRSRQNQRNVRPRGSGLRSA